MPFSPVAAVVKLLSVKRSGAKVHDEKQRARRLLPRGPPWWGSSHDGSRAGSSNPDVEQPPPPTIASGLKRIESAVNAVTAIKRITQDVALAKVRQALLDKKHKAASKLQEYVQAKLLLRSTLLYRQNLVDRICYEEQTREGFARFLNLLAIFVFLLLALQLSNKTEHLRDIHFHLRDSFNIDSAALDSINSIPKLKDQLDHVQDAAKGYMRLSSKYFKEQEAAMEFQGTFRTFKKAKRLYGTYPRVDSEFTLNAWVRAETTFQEGYLLRKQMNSDSSLSCWAFKLSRTRGPVVEYGAHDSFEFDAHEVIASGFELGRPTKGQVEVSSSNWTWYDSTGRFLLDTPTMLSFTVTKTSVSIYVHAKLVSTIPLPRPITDCESSMGLLVGHDTTLWLGQVRFYPKALSDMLVTELHWSGGLLNDLARGSGPEDAGLLSEVDDAETNIVNRVGTVEDQMDKFFAGDEAKKTTQTLVSVEELTTVVHEAAQLAATGTFTPASQRPQVNCTESPSEDGPQEEGPQEEVVVRCPVEHARLQLAFLPCASVAQYKTPACCASLEKYLSPSGDFANCMCQPVMLENIETTATSFGLPSSAVVEAFEWCSQPPINNTMRWAGQVYSDGTPACPQVSSGGGFQSQMDEAIAAARLANVSGSRTNPLYEDLGLQATLGSSLASFRRRAFALTQPGAVLSLQRAREEPEAVFLYPAPPCKQVVRWEVQVYNNVNLDYVHHNGIVQMSFPHVPGLAAEGGTLTFWHRSDNGLNLELTNWRTDASKADTSQYTFTSLLGWENIMWRVKLNIHDDYMQVSPPLEVEGTETRADSSFFTTLRLSELGLRGLYSPRGGPQWRLYAFEFDRDEDTFALYIDGRKVLQSKLANNVRVADLEANAPYQLLTVDCTSPLKNGVPTLTDQNMHSAFEFLDMKIYPGPPLSPDNHLALQKATTAIFQPDSENEDGSKLRCDDTNDLYDKPFKNNYGNDCSFYHRFRQESPMLCQNPRVRGDCPVACMDRELCILDNPAAYTGDKLVRLWESIRPMDSHGGTICLSSDVDPREVVSHCRDTRAGLPAAARAMLQRPVQDWQRRELEELDDSRLWDLKLSMDKGVAKLNLLDCEAVEKAIDPYCVLDEPTLVNFTQQSQAALGYSLLLWMRPLDYSEPFVPNVEFLADLYPSTSPQLSLAADIYHDMSDRPSKPAFSLGSADRYPLAPVPGARSSQYVDFGHVFPAQVIEQTSDGWYCYALSVNNREFYASDVGGVVTDIVTMSGPMIYRQMGAGVQRFFNASKMFKAVVFPGRAMVAPPLLLPYPAPRAQLQSTFYATQAALEPRVGPKRSAKATADLNIRVIKKKFDTKITLITPPVVSQTRAISSATCEAPFGSKWLRSEHTKAVESLCTADVTCPARMTDHVDSLISCGRREMREPFFGLFGIEEDDGSMAFNDLLQSYTDNDFIYRSGELELTDDFIDTQTKELRVDMVFIAPELGTMTLVQFTAQVGVQVRSRARIRHYEPMYGSDLDRYIVQQCMCCLCMLVLLFDVGRHLYRNLKAYWKHTTARRTKHSMIFKDMALSDLDMCLDAMVVVLMTVYLVLRIPQKIASEGKVEEIVTAISDIPWSASDIEPWRKQEIFHSVLLRLKALIEEEETMNHFGSGIVLLMLYRIIVGTKFHPRVALLTATLTKALDDLWHFALLIGLILVSFAMFGTWRFGSTHYDFRTLQSTMEKQFEMMIMGDFPDQWTSSGTEMVTFTLLFISIVFLLALNFLLAIIVEAYMGVRQQIQDVEIDLSVMHDIYTSNIAVIKRYLYGWPSLDELAAALQVIFPRRNIGYMDLRRLATCWEQEGSPLFRNQRAVVTFLRHYHEFDCVKAQALPKRPEDDVVDEVMYRSALEAGRLPMQQIDRILVGHRLRVAQRSANPNRRVEAFSSKWGSFP